MITDLDIVHVAGAPFQVGTRVRQRCAWCGALIMDVDDPMHPGWAVHHLVAMTDGAWTPVVLDEADNLPRGFCGFIDPDVTV